MKKFEKKARKKQDDFEKEVRGKLDARCSLEGRTEGVDGDD